MLIIKRDGQTAEFDQSKIYSAVFKASQASGENMEPIDLEYITHKVVSQLSDPCTVEQVQDVVERMLIRYDYEKTAKAYILYREQRSKLRNFKSELMEIYDEIVGTDAIDSDIKRENANVDGDTAMGTMLKFGSEGSKYYVDHYVLPEKIAKAHIDGDIHIHDKDFYTLTETCVTADTVLELKIENERKSIKAKDLEEMFPEIKAPNVVCYVGGLEIMSGGKFTEVINVVSHSSEDKTVLRINTDFGSLEVTSDHRVSTFNPKNLIEDLKACDITPGMILVKNVEGNLVSAEVKSIERIEYDGKVYDLETFDHHFDANGFKVHNCCQIDLVKLFKGGFSTGHGYLREPQSIGSYASLACIAIQANQNEMHGGQSVPNFDYAMAPGVLKTFKRELKKALMFAYEDMVGEYAIDEDTTKTMSSVIDTLETISFDTTEFGEKLFEETEPATLSQESFLGMADRTYERAFKATDRATYQAMEALIHNLNTMHSRAGAQVPFSSVNFGTDTSPEGRMVIKNLLLATDAGLGNGETAIFPVSIFKVKEGISYNPGDPNYDLFKLAIKVSAKRLFPNFSFLDAPFNLPFYKKGDYNTEVAYMGCRTRVMANAHDPTKAVVCGRGNLSFTSINLPRLGIEAQGDFNKFYKSLDEKMELVAEQLLHRLKIQSAKKGKNYPFLMGQGIWIDSDNIGPDDTVGEILKEGTLSIGFIGLAETMVALTGKHHGEDEEARKKAYEIIKHMREFCDRKSEETGLNFTLLATPAEGLSGRFVKIDRKKYGVIPGVTDRDYYTNSFHVPVYYPISAFEKLDIEAPYHNLTNAG